MDYMYQHTYSLTIQTTLKFYPKKIKHQWQYLAMLIHVNNSYISPPHYPNPQLALCQSL